ncbi:phosphatase PAP2 family protein [Actinomadura darangshiensis]|uniref:Phosphatase PAP2 family protein n=2 Tax=Actinomadura darangshiensis TaxID=705336 RepID=A0A4R5AP73_9ACTN|nr:phosphatase PAP2 family protein [Actinomadura darangshiensis]
MLYGAGIFITTAVGLILGEVLQRFEHPVDWAVFHWVEDASGQGWLHAMTALGRMGDPWPTRYTAIVAIVILTGVAIARRERFWVPAGFIGGSVVVEKFDQTALAKIVDRGHPPTGLGTFPSGGCVRILVIYGAIMLVVLAYLRAGRVVRSFGWSLIATMAFAEGYTRIYVGKHWATDVLGGWVLGGLMLAVTVFAGRALLARERPPLPAGRDGAAERNPPSAAAAADVS